MESAVDHPVDRGEEGQRTLFDRLAEAASNWTSSPAFFALCIVLVALWAGSYALGSSDTLKHLLGEVLAAVTLLLLALLKNAERRAEHAMQEKLDAIAGGLRKLAAGDVEGADRQLREAEGLHDEV